MFLLTEHSQQIQPTQGLWKLEDPLQVAIVVVVHWTEDIEVNQEMKYRKGPLIETEVHHLKGNI